MSTTEVGVSTAEVAVGATDVGTGRANAGRRVGTGATGPRRRTDLLGLRGVFTLLIVAFHSWQWTHPGATPAAGSGPVAVVAAQLHWSASWFFIVTAFLLSRPIFERHLDGRGVMPAGRFMLRRVLRVGPAYWVVILIVWSARNPHFPVDWRDLVEHLTFTQAFDTKRIFFTDGPTWSLTTEVFFYLAIALAIIPFCRLLSGLSRRAQLLGVFVPGAALVVGGLAFGLVAIHSGIPDEQWATWFGPLAQGPALGAGLLLAALAAVLAQADRPEISARAAAVARGAGLVVIALSATVPYSGTSTSAGLDFTQRLVSTAGLVLLVGGTVLGPQHGQWFRTLSSPVLTYLGTISYSLYLWHEPVLLGLGRFGLLPQQPDDLFRTVVVLSVAAVLVGTVAYHLVERPCLNLLGLLATGTTERYEVLPHDSADPASYLGPRPAAAAAVGDLVPVPTPVPFGQQWWEDAGRVLARVPAFGGRHFRSVLASGALLTAVAVGVAGTTLHTGSSRPHPAAAAAVAVPLPPRPPSTTRMHAAPTVRLKPEARPLLPAVPTPVHLVAATPGS